MSKTSSGKNGISSTIEVKKLRVSSEVFPSSVDLQLLGACNLECPFCFGPRHEIKAMPTRETKRLLRVITQQGAERVVLTGGEPTLIRDLPSILRYAKALGLATIVSSNGLLVKKRMDQIMPHIDWLGLPLDGDSCEVNQFLRKGHSSHFQIVLETIPLLRAHYPHVSIKLGTVVTRVNKNHIKGIADLVVQNGAKPDTWKLYQLSPSNYGRDNYDWLSIDDDEFEYIASEARQRAESYDINFVAYTNRGRNGQYLFVDPFGEALTVRDDDYCSIGNVFQDLAGVIKLLPTHHNREKVEANFRKKYPNNFRRTGCKGNSDSE